MSGGSDKNSIVFKIKKEVTKIISIENIQHSRLVQGMIP